MRHYHCTRDYTFHSDVPSPLHQYQWFDHVAHVHKGLVSRVKWSQKGLVEVLRTSRPWDHARLHWMDHTRHHVNDADRTGETALHVAVKNRDVSAVHRLLEHCADVDAKTNQKLSPLHVAAMLGHSHITKLLAELGKACVTARNVSGMSPLHIAAKHGHADIVKYFIEQHGANANDRDGVDSTPLHLAVQCGRKDAVRVLVDYGADVLAEDRRRQTPSGLAQLLGMASFVHLFEVVVMFSQRVAQHYQPAGPPRAFSEHFDTQEHESLSTHYCSPADWDVRYVDAA